MRLRNCSHSPPETRVCSISRSRGDYVAQPLREVLVDKKYLVGDELTSADIVIGGVLL
ncbi:glutathione binding-like protein [Cylindrospermum sp. FACHB-282]|uniref:glutathione binding-like protein n=1 Tax=Cylindrospermum sp. FACHB-282 TaxID=2692794 RepID=UPI0016853F49|nr:hypothetical protein [Cylindrospermum sp. FACHB-282]